MDELDALISNLDLIFSEEQLKNLADTFEYSLNLTLQNITKETNNNIKLAKDYFNEYYNVINDEGYLKKFTQKQMIDNPTHQNYIGLKIDQMIDFDEIKEIIHKNFPYLIIRLISGNDADRGKKITFFEASSFNHFTEECKKYKDMCDYGFSIDVYIREHLLIIEVGDESKKLVDDLYNQRMRNSIRDELKKKNWAQAIKKVLIFINYRLSGQEIIKFSKSNDYPQIFILTIMFPSFLIGIIILTIILYFGSTKYIFCGEVKLFFDGIIHNLEELNSAQDPDKKRIQLKKRQCLFCWQPSEGNEYFMHCGHSYHEQCLRQWNLIVYGCCPCSYEAYEDDKEDETACLNNNTQKLSL